MYGQLNYGQPSYGQPIMQPMQPMVIQPIYMGSNPPMGQPMPTVIKIDHARQKNLLFCQVCQANTDELK